MDFYCKADSLGLSKLFIFTQVDLTDASTKWFIVEHRYDAYQIIFHKAVLISDKK